MQTHAAVRLRTDSLNPTVLFCHFQPEAKLNEKKWMLSLHKQTHPELMQLPVNDEQYELGFERHPPTLQEIEKNQTRMRNRPPCEHSSVHAVASCQNERTEMSGDRSVRMLSTHSQRSSKKKTAQSNEPTLKADRRTEKGDLRGWVHAFKNIVE